MTPSGPQRKTVKELREERGLSQMALAVKLGISLSGIQGVEYGWNEPRVKLALKIADALGVRVDEIEWLHNPRPRGKETPRAA